MNLQILISIIFISSTATATEHCGSFEPLIFSDATISYTDKSGKQVNDYAIKQAKAGKYLINAGDTDALITNIDTKSSCTAKVGIVGGGKEDVFAIKGNTERVLYNSSSGSETYLSLVDMKDCKTVWEAFKHTVHKVKGHSIEIKSDCGKCEELNDFTGTCDCHAAEVWKLNKSCDLTLNEKASKKKNLRELKVSFTGQKKIRNAKSSSAKVMD